VGPVAYTHFINSGTMTDKDGTQSHVVVRSTDVWRKIDGKWLIVEEHNSVPVDMATGKPDMLSTP
jgi:ketosteroid isomerase-like protein